MVNKLKIETSALLKGKSDNEAEIYETKLLGYWAKASRDCRWLRYAANIASATPRTTNGKASIRAHQRANSNACTVPFSPLLFWGQKIFSRTWQYVSARLFMVNSLGRSHAPKKLDQCIETADLLCLRRAIRALLKPHASPLYLVR